MTFCPSEFFASTLERSAFTPDRVEVYKSTTNADGAPVDLRMHLFFPAGQVPGTPVPGIVFFFGGGWLRGTPEQFYPHCRYLAERGMVAASAEYRTENEHGTPPEACVADGITALTWMHAQSKALGITSDQLLAGGGSAGGHVAAATALLSGFREAEEEGPYHPKALILFNPVLDNSPAGYGHDRVPEPWESFSPLHNVGSAAPPTIIFLGDQDALIPVSTCESFRDLIAETGVLSRLHVYPGQTHGFFNWGSRPMFIETVTAMDAFLTELGYLPPQ